MNGIFDTLVQRERGQADALAPRLPALFESAPVSDELPMPVERGAVAKQAAAAPVQPQPPRQPSNDVPQAQAAAPATMLSAPPLAPQPARVNSTPAVPPAAPSPQPATLHTIETRTLPVVRVERETVSVPLARPTVPLQPMQQSSAVQHPALPPFPAPQATQPVRTQAAPVPIAPARQPIDVRVVPAHAPQAQRTQPVQVRQRAMPQPAAAAQPMAPAQAPDVHITIGRVEVRASGALARPARTASTGPAPVSLDQYLSQRNKQGTP